MTTVELRALTVRKEGTDVVRDLSVSVDSGSVLALLGSSGSGKTSVLRAIAGLDDVAAGRIVFDGADVTGAHPAERRVAFVFQEPVLFPRRSVGRNIAFPLEVQHRPLEEIRLRVGAEARALHIEDLLQRRPDLLSAGEAQVVQVARALVKQPDVLLLDEPFARVDAHTTAELRREVLLIQRGFGVTTVLAANEPADAMTMADRIAVIEEGRLVQLGAPISVYEQPATVNSALLTGQADVLEVDVTGDVDGSWLVRPGLRIRAWQPALASYRGRRLQLLVRPEWWQLDPNGTIDADVVRVAHTGASAALWCSVGGRPMTLTVRTAGSVGVGVRLRVRLDRYVLFDPRTGRRADLSANDA